MKILLLGKNGQAGWELQRSLAPLGDLIALDRNSCELCGDLANLSGIAETVSTLKPDIIVNAAAYTAVDKAETERDVARVINAEAPGILAKEAEKIDALLVHYSTDYVFDGHGHTPWQETDGTGPLSHYGQTKLDGEIAIQASGCRHLIFRTSWIYAARGNNFAKTILRLAQERDSLNIINDQVGAPTGAELLADVTAHALRNTTTTGLYHLAASGECSWYDYARLVVNLAQKAGIKTKTTVDSIAPISTQAYPTPAKRPLNSRLNTAKLKQTLGLHLPDWQSGVERMLGEILNNSH